VENLCHKLFTEITQMGFRLAKLEVQETDTSIVSYTREEWVADNRYFGQQSAAATHAEAIASH
jgi:6-pyruvoyltetrahydropterin/6-carboxytetrahydropterin synthase